MLKSVIEEIRKKMEKERGELIYSKGIGITSLIYCPLKWEYRQKYPNLKIEKVEIDDGFSWELLVKEGLKAKYGPTAIEEEKILTYEIDSFCIEGHLDIYVKPEKTGIEVKHTKLTLVNFPVDSNMKDIIDATHPLAEKIPISEHYLLQAKIELFILRKEISDATLRLWVKTTLKGSNRKHKKVVFEKLITEPATEEEVKNLIQRFKSDKSPRFPWECKYCPYKTVCDFYKKRNGIEEILEVSF